MKQVERELLSEFMGMIDKVPFPASGSQSTTVAGLAGYAADMEQWTPACKRFMYALLVQDFDSEGENPKVILETMKGWLRLRDEIGWQFPTGSKYNVPTLSKMIDMALIAVQEPQS